MAFQRLFSKGLTPVINERKGSGISGRIKNIQPIYLHLSRAHHPWLLNTIDEAQQNDRYKQ